MVGIKKIRLHVIILCILLLNACATTSQRQVEPTSSSVSKQSTQKPVALFTPTSTAITDVTPEYIAGSSKIVSNQILVISKKGSPTFKNTDKQLKVNQEVNLNQLAVKVTLLTLKRDKLDKNALTNKMTELRKKNSDLIIQPNYIYYVDGKENSNHRSIPQYALKMTGLNQQINTQGRGIKIALIDTPVDTQHPALKGAFIKKYNFVQSKGKRHATAIAGILVGRGRIKGVAPAAQLISIGAFNEPNNSRSLGLSTSFVLGKAFNKALEEKVHIINLSFGSTEVDPLMKQLAAETISRNILLLASVGNDNHQTSVRYPAALKGVYAITAVDAKSKIYKRANTGNTVDYALPGVGILTSKPGGKYTSVTGTSFANAYATGIFALQLSQKAALNKLNSKVRDLGQSGKDRFFGRGLMTF